MFVYDTISKGQSFKKEISTLENFNVILLSYPHEYSTYVCLDSYSGGEGGGMCAKSDTNGLTTSQIPISFKGRKHVHVYRQNDVIL